MLPGNLVSISKNDVDKVKNNNQTKLNKKTLWSTMVIG